MAMLKYYKVHPDVSNPAFATVGSACFDLKAYLGTGIFQVRGYCQNNRECNVTIYDNKEDRYVSIDPGQRLLIPTGLIFDIPRDHSVRVHARSGMALKQGLVMANAEGIIDWDYVEETHIMVCNISAEKLYIHNGERIAQGELVPVLSYGMGITEVKPQQKTQRNGGFGSTGVRGYGSTGGTTE
jgi:dUTP pyrophosphatase